MRLLITGSSGFIGSALVSILDEQNIDYRLAVRSETNLGVIAVNIGEINSKTDWRSALEDIDVVIHLAGRAHISQKDYEADLRDHRRVNTAGTLRLAEQMIEVGCRRLIFISTIGVNGDSTPINQPFTEQSIPNPQQPYAIAKWEAEQGLLKLSTQLEIVIIRPPLVYGLDAPGNFGKLLQLLRTQLPLPFRLAKNKRSFIAVHNLCEFLILCIDHPKAANQTFLVSDDESVSTFELLTRIANALDVNLTLLPIPPIIIRLMLKLIGRDRMGHQLFGSLVIDNSKASKLLDWKPSITIEKALAYTES